MQERFRIFIAGMLFAIGSWIIVIGMREELLTVFATTNQYIIGFALIIFAWLIGGKNKKW